VRRPLLVAEDITIRRSLFRVFGVTWSGTRYAWMSPLSWTALGLGVSLANPQDWSAFSVAVAALGYGTALYAANILHSIGHVIAGWAVGAPVESVLVTSTRDVVIYVQPGAASPVRCRLGRALGGPAANLAVGVSMMLAGHSTQTGWLLAAGLVNVCVAVWTLMPVPSLDGWVIWSILTQWKHDGA
jgi:Zn-dependent protease